MKIRKGISLTIMYLVLIIALAFVFFPVVYMILGSFKTNMEIMLGGTSFLPKIWSLDNYKIIWNSTSDFNAPKLFWNSTWYTVISVFLTVFSSCLGGYVFERGHFKGQKFWFGIFSMLMFVNFGGATIVPQMNIISSLGLMGSLWGLIIVQFFGINIVNIYLVRSFIASLPKEIDEAAAIDGCSFFGTFIHIIAPLLKPVVATITMLGFQGTWNSYMMPMLYTMSDPSKGTLVSALFSLKNSGNAAANWNIMLAGSVIASIPVIIIYMFGNKYFMSNLTDGAVKG